MGSGMDGLPVGSPPARPPFPSDTISVSAPDTVRAEIAYKYPESIRQKEAKDIWVYVKVHSPPDAVVAELKNRIESYEHIVQSEDTLNIYTTSIGLYENLTVQLIDPANDFSVTPIHREEKQVIDFQRGNEWHWVIQTETEKENALLIIKVSSDQEERRGSSEVSTKQIPIRITLERAWFRKGYTWLYNNPEYAISGLLVPFLLFVGKRVIARRSKKQ